MEQGRGSFGAAMATSLGEGLIFQRTELW
jgi:hypothetical protein